MTLFIWHIRKHLLIYSKKLSTGLFGKPKFVFDSLKKKQMLTQNYRNNHEIHCIPRNKKSHLNSIQTFNRKLYTFIGPNVTYSNKSVRKIHNYSKRNIVHRS